MTVKELRVMLTSLPEGYDDYDVRLVVDKASFIGPMNSPFGVSQGKWAASEPLVRVSSPDENSVKHRRVWLYGEGP